MAFIDAQPNECNRSQSGQTAQSTPSVPPELKEAESALLEARFSDAFDAAFHVARQARNRIEGVKKSRRRAATDPACDLSELVQLRKEAWALIRRALEGNLRQYRDQQVYFSQDDRKECALFVAISMVVFQVPEADRALTDTIKEFFEVSIATPGPRPYHFWDSEVIPTLIDAAIDQTGKAREVVTNSIMTAFDELISERLKAAKVNQAGGTALHEAVRIGITLITAGHRMPEPRFRVAGQRIVEKPLKSYFETLRERLGPLDVARGLYNLMRASAFARSENELLNELGPLEAIMGQVHRASLAEAQESKDKEAIRALEEIGLAFSPHFNSYIDSLEDG